MVVVVVLVVVVAIIVNHFLDHEFLIGSKLSLILAIPPEHQRTAPAY